MDEWKKKKKVKKFLNSNNAIETIDCNNLIKKNIQCEDV